MSDVGIALAEVAFIVLLFLATELGLWQSVVTNDAEETWLPGRIASLALVGYVQGDEAFAVLLTLVVKKQRSE